MDSSKVAHTKIVIFTTNCTSILESFETEIGLQDPQVSTIPCKTLMSVELDFKSHNSMYMILLFEDN